jgi:hypothetical protein
MANTIKFEHVWAMPNKKTFTIKPIEKLLQEETRGKVLDPFPFPFQTDALELMRKTETESIDTGYYDPPYSLRQLKEVYESKGLALTQHMTQSYWHDIEQEWGRIIKPGGKVIKFGWNSGRIKGFEITRILLVVHGGHHNDTIVTVQTKQNGNLFGEQK